jgi:hypothetical protein
MAGKKQSAAKKSGKHRRTPAPEERFTGDLLTRGEAVASEAPAGKLPPGATHRLQKDETGATTVKRARFKLL